VLKGGRTADAAMGGLRHRSTATSTASGIPRDTVLTLVQHQPACALCGPNRGVGRKAACAAPGDRMLPTRASECEMGPELSQRGMLQISDSSGTHPTGTIGGLDLRPPARPAVTSPLHSWGQCITPATLSLIHSPSNHHAVHPVLRNGCASGAYGSARGRPHQRRRTGCLPPRGRPAGPEAACAAAGDRPGG
jgi:hypothetical protein